MCDKLDIHPISRMSPITDIGDKMGIPDKRDNEDEDGIEYDWYMSDEEDEAGIGYEEDEEDN